MARHVEAQDDEPRPRQHGPPRTAAEGGPPLQKLPPPDVPGVAMGVAIEDRRMRAVAFGPQQGARDRTLPAVEDHLLAREPGVRRGGAPVDARPPSPRVAMPRSARSLSRSRLSASALRAAKRGGQDPHSHQRRAPGPHQPRHDRGPRQPVARACRPEARRPAR
jgi:hypothetical protein